MNTPRTANKPPTHTVFGAGQIGRQLASELLARGHHVRIVRRGEPGAARPNLSWLRGDITDREFARAAVAGSEVVYNCTNPSQYHTWDEILPPLYAAVIDAASHAGARLVVVDNLYMYGRPPGGEPMDEDTPINPCSRKGALRARLAGELLEAHRSGVVQVAIGRASDYFGPSSPNNAVFRDQALERLSRGKPVQMLGDPDQPHSYNYTTDVARGLAVLGEHAEAFGHVWHLPVAHQGTTRELVDLMAAELGVEPKVQRIPSWVARAIGVFSPTIRAAAEMTYQWEGAFILDDSRFRAAFGEASTPIDHAVADTLAEWRVEFGFNAAIRQQG